MVGRLVDIWWISTPVTHIFCWQTWYLFIILVAIQQNQQKLTDTLPEQIVEHILTSKYLTTTDAFWPTNTHGEFTWLYNIGLQTYVMLLYNCSDFHYNAIAFYIFLSLHVAFQSMYHFIPDHSNPDNGKGHRFDGVPPLEAFKDLGLFIGIPAILIFFPIFETKAAGKKSNGKISEMMTFGKNSIAEFVFSWLLHGHGNYTLQD